MRNGKRILSVKIIQAVDECPDTSYLGEYSDKATSRFSIDRAHSEDCILNNPARQEYVDKLERAIQSLNAPRMAQGECNKEWEAINAAQDLMIEKQDELADCDCNGYGVSSREYRYFNPSFNYVDKAGEPLDLTPEDIIKYIRQDYDRMEDYNRGGWCYLSIGAEACISIPSGQGSVESKVNAGWCSGFESDSDDSYLEEQKQNAKAELKDKLFKLGFSRRAIATAFKSIQEISE